MFLLYKKSKKERKIMKQVKEKHFRLSVNYWKKEIQGKLFQIQLFSLKFNFLFN